MYFQNLFVTDTAQTSKRESDLTGELSDTAENKQPYQASLSDLLDAYQAQVQAYNDLYDSHGYNWGQRGQGSIMQEPK